jgi:outer membrane lipoprotein-sorting protein
MLAVATAARGDSVSARRILDRVDDLFRGESAHGRVTMTISTEHWTRSLQMEFWSRGKENSLIRILAPKKEKGTTTLKSGNDIWNYLPKVKRVIKLPSSMMSTTWMGSHFTNDDIVKQSRMADDYTFEITHQGPRQGADVIEITCHPKEDAAVVWGKVVVVVRNADLIPIKIDYYDEDLQPARTFRYSETRTMGGRDLPTRLEVTPVDKPTESTVVSYEEVTFDVALPDDLFSLRTLQR